MAKDSNKGSFISHPDQEARIKKNLECLIKANNMPNVFYKYESYNNRQSVDILR